MPTNRSIGANAFVPYGTGGFSAANNANPLPAPDLGPPSEVPYFGLQTYSQNPSPGPQVNVYGGNNPYFGAGMGGPSVTASGADRITPRPTPSLLSRVGTSIGRGLERAGTMGILGRNPRNPIIGTAPNGENVYEGRVVPEPGQSGIANWARNLFAGIGHGSNAWQGPQYNIAGGMGGTFLSGHSNFVNGGANQSLQNDIQNSLSSRSAGWMDQASMHQPTNFVRPDMVGMVDEEGQQHMPGQRVPGRGGYMGNGQGQPDLAAYWAAQGGMPQAWNPRDGVMGGFSGQPRHQAGPLNGFAIDGAARGQPQGPNPNFAQTMYPLNGAVANRPIYGTR